MIIHLTRASFLSERVVEFSVVQSFCSLIMSPRANSLQSARAHVCHLPFHLFALSTPSPISYRVHGNVRLRYVGMVTIILNDYPALKYVLVAVMGLFVLTNKE